MNDASPVKQFTPVQPSRPRYGSDLIAAALREQGFPYICLNPGASYRHLHDSLVNFLGNETPKIVLCMHEEHAVGIAQGWGKVMDRPLAVAVHSNVGLMHASMGIFDAWCDRTPVVVLGATGPLDATKRRPWIEWIHCTLDQGGLVRNYTKWDDEPASPEAAVESIRRATMLATARPGGPVYVNLDVSVQAMELDAVPDLHDVSRFRAPADPEPPRAELERAIAILGQAQRPFILCGRTSRSEEGWRERVRLAELTGARVITHVKLPCSFPTTHPLFAGEVGWKLPPKILQLLQGSDAVLSLDWLDLAGTVNQAFPPGGASPPIVSVSNDFHVHRGWNMDYQGLPAIEVNIPTVPETATARLVEALAPVKRAPAYMRRSLIPEAPAASGPISLMDLARAFGIATRDQKVCLTSRPLGWPNNANELENPHDYFGHNGGGGVGSGPSIGIGVALALRDLRSERVPVAILGDGDFTMGMNSLWTAAHERIPLLFVIANNRSYFNDEHHQGQVAAERGRPVGNAWVGQRLEDPVPDLLMLARAQGIDGEEHPIEDLADLPAALERGLREVRGGRPWVIDVRVPPEYARDPLFELV